MDVLTFTAAFTEAVSGWVAPAAAEHRRSELFMLPSPLRRP
jgi:hypothetical protein